jgi:polyferredoxin
MSEKKTGFGTLQMQEGTVSVPRPHFEGRKSPKYWLKSQQRWTWVITIAWMTVANFWPPFGLYGFVCMFTPIILALSGWGKVSCARICPRGSFIGTFTRRISFGREMPHWFHTKRFRFALWAVMMGSFIGLLIWAVPQGVYTTGRTVLYFMEAATVLAFLSGVVFRPRSWCTVCPMGYTSGNIRDMLKKRSER